MFSAKKTALALALSAACAMPAKSQEKGVILTYLAKTCIGLGGSPEFNSVNFSFSPGYRFDRRWFAELDVEAAVDLFRAAGDKTYRANMLLGASAGFDALHTETDRLAVVVGAGNSLRTKAWNYTYIDAGVKWTVGKGDIRFMLGTGVRRYAAHDSKFDSYWSWYIAAGFTFE